MTTEILLSLIILFFLIILLGFLFFWKKNRRLSSQTLEKIKTSWKEIELLSEQSPEQAILKADTLLDFTLDKKGLKGSLGEKLKKSPGLFSHLNGLWMAHKLRNRIAHEIDIHITPLQTKSSLKAFKRAFSDLGISL